MSDHSELLEDARDQAAALAPCRAGTILRTLADVVAAYDKADSELLAACKTCDATMSTLICEHDDFRVITEGAWTNLRAARHLTRNAVDNWKKANVDATLAVATRDHSELMERLADDPTTNQASEPVPEPAFVLDDDCPADPVEVAMRIKHLGDGLYRWQTYLCGVCVQDVGLPSFSPESAKRYANAWLARVSTRFGVPLKAVWEETKGGE